MLVNFSPLISSQMYDFWKCNLITICSFNKVELSLLLLFKVYAGVYNEFTMPINKDKQYLKSSLYNYLT